MKLLFPIPHVNDYTCGYRAYKKSLIQRAFSLHGEKLIEARSFSVMAEVLIKLSRMGAKAREVPLILEYQLKGGSSKLKLFRTIFDYMRVILRILLRLK